MGGFILSDCVGLGMVIDRFGDDRDELVERHHSNAKIQTSNIETTYVDPDIAMARLNRLLAKIWISHSDKDRDGAELEWRNPEYADFEKRVIESMNAMQEQRRACLAVDPDESGVSPWRWDPPWW